MTKVSTVKAPKHGPTLTGKGNNWAGSCGPSHSPIRRNGYLQKAQTESIKLPNQVLDILLQMYRFDGYYDLYLIIVIT